MKGGLPPHLRQMGGIDKEANNRKDEGLVIRDLVVFLEHCSLISIIYLVLK